MGPLPRHPLPKEVDLLIVGGGIVGLATAYAATQRFPGRSILLVEKEAKLAAHQTGHNSGVIHSGLYYPPGSRKAELCRRGRRALLAFCNTEAIPTSLCGKLILATQQEELPRLEDLQTHATKNSVIVQRLSGTEIRELEPAAGGIAGLQVPETGIVDYSEVAGRLGSIVEASGGQLSLGQRLLRLSPQPTRAGQLAEFEGGARTLAAHVIVCAGLQSDRVARRCGEAPRLRIVPFRGEYFRLSAPYAAQVRGLIYPVPDPRYPFLGVHLTRTLHGEVLAGPNAVLALAREGYARHAFSLRDTVSILGFPGALRLFAGNLSFGLRELHRSYSRRRFALATARLLPGLGSGDLEPGPCGIRAQAVRSSGALVEDFELIQSEGVTHVLNAPSPAATASLAIGEQLIETLKF